MIAMHLEIESSAANIPSVLFGSADPRVGDSISIPGGATLSYSSSASRRGFGPGAAYVTEFVITFASGVASSMVASWLYDNIKNRITRLSIDDRPISISEESLREILERERKNATDR